MSEAATSFCRSTNSFGPRPVRCGDGTSHSGAAAPRRRRRRVGGTDGAAAVEARAARRGGARREPLRRGTRRARSCRCTRPPSARPAPTCPGTKHARASSKRGLPPDCACRCTTGLQPPDTASRSQSNLVRARVTRRRSRRAPCTSTPRDALRAARHRRPRHWQSRRSRPCARARAARRAARRARRRPRPLRCPPRRDRARCDRRCRCW